MCCTLLPNLPLLGLLRRETSGKPEVQIVTLSSSFLSVLNWGAPEQEQGGKKGQLKVEEMNEKGARPANIN